MTTARIQLFTVHMTHTPTNYKTEGWWSEGLANKNKKINKKFTTIRPQSGLG